jgi:hypothetical protein
MIKYIVQMVDNYSGEVLETMDEEFDTYKEAEEYCLVCSSNFSAGAEVLELAGEEYCDPNDVEYVVESVEK